MYVITHAQPGAPSRLTVPLLPAATACRTGRRLRCEFPAKTAFDTRDSVRNEVKGWASETSSDTRRWPVATVAGGASPTPHPGRHATALVRSSFAAKCGCLAGGITPTRQLFLTRMGRRAPRSGRRWTVPAGNWSLQRRRGLPGTAAAFWSTTMQSGSLAETTAAARTRRMCGDPRMA
jgi:hypothetical protein